MPAMDLYDVCTRLALDVCDSCFGKDWGKSPEHVKGFAHLRQRLFAETATLRDEMHAYEAALKAIVARAPEDPLLVIATGVLNAWQPDRRGGK
jgi:hypothetical protein